MSLLVLFNGRLLSSGPPPPPTPFAYAHPGTTLARIDRPAVSIEHRVATDLSAVSGRKTSIE